MRFAIVSAHGLNPILVYQTDGFTRITNNMHDKHLTRKRRGWHLLSVEAGAAIDSDQPPILKVGIPCPTSAVSSPKRHTFTAIMD